jgi:Tfp pilus assembly protein PilX
MNKNKVRTSRRHRGVAFITALLVAVVMLILIGALLTQISGDLIDVGNRGFDNRALYAADAGIQEFTEQMEITAGNPASSYSATLGDSTFNVTLDNTWSADNRYFLVTSKGVAGNNVRYVRAILQTVPYSYWGNFTISECFKNGGGRCQHYYIQDESITGPVYSGGPMHINYSSTPGLSPIFLGKVRTAQSPIWNDINPAGTGSPDTATPSPDGAWHNVLQGGKPDFSVDPSGLQLPAADKNFVLASEAWAGNAGTLSSSTGYVAPSAGRGLYVDESLANTAGSGAITTGLYLYGDVNVTSQAQVPGLDSGNSQTFTFTPVASDSNSIVGAYTVKLDFNLNQTVVNYYAPPARPGSSSPTSTSTYSGLPTGQQVNASAGHQANGSVFVDGSVNLGENGTTDYMHGQFTIGTPDPPVSGETISLRGNFKYRDDPRVDPQSTDMLGLWANDILIKDKVDSNVEFDGNLLTGSRGECTTNTGTSPCGDGTWYNPDIATSGNLGDWTIFGSLVENIPGFQGDPIGGSDQKGYADQYIYDPRAAVVPPPFFPDTNLYFVIAWEDLGVNPP